MEKMSNIKMRAVQPWPIVFRDASLLVLTCVLAASLVNGFRKQGLLFVQKEEYQILVPCPEKTGEVKAVSADSVDLYDKSILLIDARSSQEYQKWHLANALNVPYDYLEPTSETAISQIAGSSVKGIVVYGDGHNPDSGEQLAKELSGKGIRNVSFVVGGVSAVMPNTEKETP